MEVSLSVLGLAGILACSMYPVSYAQESPVAEFNSCGSTGATGPTEDQCEKVYGAIFDVFSTVIVKGMQYITIPFSGVYRVQAFGASGLAPNGGKGVFVSGEFPLPQGASIRLLVGQQGEQNVTLESYGGSGGSFVFRAGDDQPMLVAGGGATPPTGSTASSRVDASIDKSGKNASEVSADWGRAGVNGEGGYSGTGNRGGGGAGFLSSGMFSGSIDPDILQAQPFLVETIPDGLLPGRGGIVLSNSIAFSAGGFGGGGYGLENSSGGGGGYSGGGGASNVAVPGGGGSYASGLNSAIAVNHTGEGKITVQSIGTGFETSCSEHEYTVSFYKDLVFGHTNFTFSDTSCLSESNESHVTISSGLNECGTTISIINDTVHFKNIIKAKTEPTDLVTRRYSIKDFTVTCIYSVRDAVSLNILPELAVLDILPQFEEGDFLMSLRAYNSSDFQSRYSNDDFPLTISTQANIFLEVGLSFKNEFEDLELLLEECFASPSANRSDGPKYSMIENGCAVDETLQYFPSVDATTRRFMFKAISFTSANLSTAFVHCQALLCNASEPSRCKEGCRRSKRSTDVFEVERLRQRASSGGFHQGKVTGAIGPFVIKDEDEGEKPAEAEKVLIIVAATLSTALLVTIVSLVMYALYLKRILCAKSADAHSAEDSRL